jgi:hypothetical protein
MSVVYLIILELLMAWLKIFSSSLAGSSIPAILEMS